MLPCAPAIHSVRPAVNASEKPDADGKGLKRLDSRIFDAGLATFPTSMVAKLVADAAKRKSSTPVRIYIAACGLPTSHTNDTGGVVEYDDHLQGVHLDCLGNSGKPSFFALNLSFLGANTRNRN